MQWISAKIKTDLPQSSLDDTDDSDRKTEVDEGEPAPNESMDEIGVEKERADLELPSDDELHAGDYVAVAWRDEGCRFGVIEKVKKNGLVVKYLKRQGCRVYTWDRKWETEKNQIIAVMHPTDIITEFSSTLRGIQLKHRQGRGNGQKISTLRKEILLKGHWTIFLEFHF